MEFGDPKPSDEIKQAFRLLELSKIQVRAAVVLGRIGDPRALPVLKKLLEPTSDLNTGRPDARSVFEAIDLINGCESG